MFAHAKAVTMPATRTIALPDSVRTNARNGADRSRAHAVRPRHRLTPARESARSGPEASADSPPGAGDAPWPAGVSLIQAPLSTHQKPHRRRRPLTPDDPSGRASWRRLDARGVSLDRLGRALLRWVVLIVAGGRTASSDARRRRRTRRPRGRPVNTRSWRPTWVEPPAAASTRQRAHRVRHSELGL
jgi:hypothetical protein